MTGFCPNCGIDLECDAPITSGALMVDPRGMCELSGQPLPLQPGEREVLHTLLKADGPVKKRIIAERIGYEGDGNIVEVYISRLRRKLGREAIATVRPGMVAWKGL